MSYALVAGSEVEVFGASSLPAAAISVGSLNVIQTRSADFNWVDGVSDTAGNDYWPLVKIDEIDVWVTIATAAHATNVVSMSGPGGFPGMLGAQFTCSDGWSRAGLLNAFDFVLNSGATGTLSRGLYTTIADALIIGFGNRDGTGQPWAAGSGFTEIVEDASNVQMMQYRTVSSLLTGTTYSITNAADCKYFGVVALVGTQSGSGGGDVVGARIFTGY